MGRHPVEVTAAQFTNIYAMLAEGKLTIREIANKLAVPRRAVEYASLHRDKTPRPSLHKAQTSLTLVGLGPVTLCPTCGHRVPSPCVYCAARRHREFGEQPAEEIDDFHLPVAFYKPPPTEIRKACLGFHGERPQRRPEDVARWPNVSKDATDDEEYAGDDASAGDDDDF